MPRVFTIFDYTDDLWKYWVCDECQECHSKGHVYCSWHEADEKLIEHTCQLCRREPCKCDEIEAKAKYKAIDRRTDQGY